MSLMQIFHKNFSYSFSNFGPVAVYLLCEGFFFNSTLAGRRPLNCMGSIFWKNSCVCVFVSLATIDLASFS